MTPVQAVQQEPRVQGLVERFPRLEAEAKKDLSSQEEWIRLHAAECLADFSLHERDWQLFEFLLTHEEKAVREIAIGRIQRVPDTARYAKYYRSLIKPRPGRTPSVPDPDEEPEAFKGLADKLIRMVAEGKGSRENARLVLQDFARVLYRSWGIALLDRWIQEAALRDRSNAGAWKAFASIRALYRKRLRRKR